MRNSLTLAALAATALGGDAMAALVTQWNFEAQTLNASTGTGVASLV